MQISCINNKPEKIVMIGSVRTPRAVTELCVTRKAGGMQWILGSLGRKVLKSARKFGNSRRYLSTGTWYCVQTKRDLRKGKKTY